MSVVLLEEASDVKKYGGKAVNLAGLLQAGLPVPGGLAVSVEAFDDAGKLKAEHATFVQDNIDKAKLYAVRSSASVEDAAEASWAGQFESFLNTGSADIVKMIEACHASAKERTKAYAGKLGDGQETFAVAVVVQEMIDPDYAGVLFTKDPVTGTDQFVVEYVEGLGEQVVSGQVTPELVAWSKGEEPKTPFNFGELINLARKTEQLFHTSQDIEWASANGKIWLLQARPITTFPPDKSV